MVSFPFIHVCHIAYVPIMHAAHCPQPGTNGWHFGCFGVSPRPVSATNPNPKRRAFSAGVVSCKMFFQHSRVHCLCKQVIHAYLQPLKLNLNLPFVRNEDARSLFCSGSFIQGESSQGQCMEPWDVAFYFFSRKSNGNHPTNLLRVRIKITRIYIMLLRVRLPR